MFNVGCTKEGQYKECYMLQKRNNQKRGNNFTCSSERKRNLTQK